MMVPQLVLAGLAVVAVLTLAGLLRAGMGPGSDFVIQYRPGGRLKVRGQVAASRVGGIKSFFENDLRPERSVTVRGTFGPGRSLRLRFSGGLSGPQQQQARNFLIEHLR